MTDYVKDLGTEVKLFEIYGLRDVLAAAKVSNVPQAEFVSLAGLVLTLSQARAFAARWPTLSYSEQAQICMMLEADHE